MSGLDLDAIEKRANGPAISGFKSDVLDLIAEVRLRDAYIVDLERQLDIAECTAAQLATDRDDAMADADAVADDWWAIKDAARAALDALPETLKPFGVFQELEAAIASGMPGGKRGAVSRAERFRAALEHIVSCIDTLDEHNERTSSWSAVRIATRDAAKMCRSIARAALGGREGEK